MSIKNLLSSEPSRFHDYVPSSGHRSPFGAEDCELGLISCEAVALVTITIEQGPVYSGVDYQEIKVNMVARITTYSFLC
jgi:hypothetical protein